MKRSHITGDIETVAQRRLGNKRLKLAPEAATTAPVALTVAERTPVSEDIRPNAEFKSGPISIIDGPRIGSLTPPVIDGRASTGICAKPTFGVGLPIVGHYRLLAPLDESAQTYTALDLRSNKVVSCRKLDANKYLHLLQLSNRLRTVDPSDDTDENRTLYKQLFPESSELIAHRQQSRDATVYYHFEPKHYGSLHAYVVERKRLSMFDTQRFFRQIASLVAYCHRRGVMVRDLKLRKFVFADPQCQTVRLDDLSEMVVLPDIHSDDSLSDRHGCPAYVSPEILDLNQRFYSGKASDIWSLGVLLFVLLVGRYPFYDVTPAGLFGKIRNAKLQFNDQSIDLEARTVIRSLLRRDPKERPTVDELLAHPWLQPRERRTERCRTDISCKSTEFLIWSILHRTTENDQCVPSVQANDRDKKTDGKMSDSRQLQAECLVPNF